MSIPGEHLSSSRQTRLLLESTYAIWVQNDLTAIDKYFTSDLKAEGFLASTSLGPDDFREFVPMINAIMTNVEVEPLILTESGVWVHLLYQCKAVSVVDKRPIDIISQLCVRFEGDKIVEFYDTFDYMTLFEQMGRLPEHTLEGLLSGETLDWTGGDIFSDDQQST